MTALPDEAVQPFLKCKTELNGHDLRGIRAFRDTYGQASPAVILHAGEQCRKLDSFTLAIPWNATPHQKPKT